MEQFVRAAQFAAVRHRGQRRKRGEVPYVNHVLGVARWVSEIGGVRDPITLIAAVLHDTIEDTDTSREELEREFGVEVADVVVEVSDDPSLSKVERKRAQIEHAPQLSHRARVLKLADKLDNLRDLAAAPPESWSPSRVRGYFCWAHAVVAAIGDANPGLWHALERVFATDLSLDGRTVRAVPEDARERAALLDAYYAELATQADD